MSDDAYQARRKAILENLREGRPTIVTPAGVPEVVDESSGEAANSGALIPEGKLAAGFYWYQNNPGLYKAEVSAMRKFFPSFKIDQLSDGSGRLYWRGKVQPSGQSGLVWDIMLIYKNDHPRAFEGEYGGSVQILPVSPRLRDLAEKMMPILLEEYGTYENTAKHGFGLGLPHIYRSNFGRNEEYFICTADPKYFKTVTNFSGRQNSTSAVSALSWACKWIFLCEAWMNGEISNDIALEGNY